MAGAGLFFLLRLLINRFLVVNKALQRHSVSVGGDESRIPLFPAVAVSGG